MEQDVRNEFLEALFDALMKEGDDPSLPLNLDFVYGSVEADGRGAFEPLDGQQRLTTLYLLHWYLAWRDGAMADFLSFIQLGDHSRFSYAIRPSSKEFFDALLSWKPDGLASIQNRLSSEIVEQSWFFRSWQLDPTIQSALAMLDAIDQKFGASIGMYGRLASDESPRITLHLLDLQSFGLSDDLYIKMNARGKPLTPFENFKARLEQHLGASFAADARVLHGQPTTLRHYFSHCIDTVWADVFWHYRDRRTSLFDDRVMNLVQVLVIVTRDPDARGSDALLTLLRNTDRPFSFRRFQENGCLDRPFIETMVAVLDAWSGEAQGIRPTLGRNSYYNEMATFERAVNDCTQLTYTQLIQFHAYCAFIRSPALIDYCKHRMIRFLSPEKIYLLSRKRMSSDHVEPFTYYFYLTDLLPMAARNELLPFGAPRYRSVNTDDEELLTDAHFWWAARPLALESRAAAFVGRLLGALLGGVFLFEIAATIAQTAPHSSTAPSCTSWPTASVIQSAIGSRWPGWRLACATDGSCSMQASWTGECASGEAGRV